MKMILITDRMDASIGLRLAGVETVLTTECDTACELLTEASKNEDIGIILVTSGIEKMCADIINKIRQLGKPLISCIPDSDKTGSVSNAITDYIANAIGINGGV